MNNEDMKIEDMLRHYKLPSPPIELKNRIFQPKQNPGNLNRLAIAASIFIVVGISLIWQVWSKSSETVINSTRLAQIEQSIVRAGEAAQLLAVADFLESQSVGKDHAQKIYYEVAHSFPDSNAGIQAQLRLKSN